MDRERRPHVSIIVLNWNGLNDTLRCLASVQAIHYPSYDVIVVDNHSDCDELSEVRRQHPEVYTIQSTANLGYAGGNNVALKHIIEEQRSPYVVVLNNDTIVHPAFLSELVMTMESDQQVGVSGSLLLDLEGITQTDRIQTAGGHVRPLTGNLEHYWVGQRSRDIPEGAFEVAYLPGASLCLRTVALAAEGLFNEHYQSYFEDTDLCYRLHEKGWKVVVVPKSIVWHRSVKDRWSETKRYFVMRNRLWFQRSHRTSFQYMITVVYWTCVKAPIQSIRLLIRMRQREIAGLLRGLRDGLRAGPTKL